MDSRELFEGGSNWRDTTARAAFPIVLRRAMDGEPITYGALNDAIVASGGKGALTIAYRYVAGKIGDVCEALSEDLGERIPPLNAIIINAESKLPSHGVDGYLAHFLGKSRQAISGLKKEDRDAYARQAIKTVLAFDGWDRIGRHLQLRVPTRTKADRGKPIPAPNPKRFAKGPETEAHKALKQWVADHPDAFKVLGRFKKGMVERTLASGDRLDVLFDNGRTRLAVEVKAAGASDDEVQRGVYQCIKDRATIQAMQLAAAVPPNANAVLVLDRQPPSVVSSLANRLSVTIVNVARWM